METIIDLDAIFRRQELFALREHLNSPPGCSLFQFFVLSYYASLCSEFSAVISVTISAWKGCSVHLQLQLFVEGRIYFFFTLFVFVLVQCCPTHIALCVCFVFHRLVYPMIMLPVSLDCPFLIAPSIFSNVYSFTELCQSLPELSFLSRRAYGTIILIEIDFFLPFCPPSGK